MARKPYTVPDGPTAEEKALERYAELMIGRIKEVRESNWEKPWIDPTPRPRNIDGRGVYHGVNWLLLSVHGMLNDYSVPAYMTSLQLNKLNFAGGDREKGPVRDAEGNKLPFLHVKKGEKGFPVTFAIKKIYCDGKEVSPEDYDRMPKGQREGCVSRIAKRVYTVFNVDQTNIRQDRPGLYEKIRDMAVPKMPVQEGEALRFEPFDRMAGEGGWLCPIIPEKQNEAFYSVRNDSITLPLKEQFKSPEAYYGTMAHEMAHSTGTEGRLGRFKDSQREDMKAYGREELVAELTSAFVLHTLGIAKEVKEESRQYLGGWLQQIEEKPEFLKSVLSDVNKASRLMVGEVEKLQKEIDAGESMGEAVSAPTVAEPTAAYGTAQEAYESQKECPLGRRFADLGPTQRFSVDAICRETDPVDVPAAFESSVEAFTRANEDAKLRARLLEGPDGLASLERYNSLPGSTRRAMAALHGNVPGYDAGAALEAVSPSAGVNGGTRLEPYPQTEPVAFPLEAPTEEAVEGKATEEAVQTAETARETASGKNAEEMEGGETMAARQEAPRGKAAPLPPFQHWLLALPDGELAAEVAKTLPPPALEAIERRYKSSPLGSFDAVVAVTEAAAKADLADGRPTLQKWLAQNPGRISEAASLAPLLAMRLQQGYTNPRRPEDAHPAALLAELKEYSDTFDVGGYEDYETELESMDSAEGPGEWYALYKDNVPGERQALDARAHAGRPGSVGFADVALFYAELGKAGDPGRAAKFDAEYYGLPTPYAAAFDSMPERERRLVQALQGERPLAAIIGGRMKALGRAAELTPQGYAEALRKNAEDDLVDIDPEDYQSMMPVERAIYRELEPTRRDTVLAMYSHLSITDQNEINLRFEAAADRREAVSGALYDIVCAVRDLRFNIENAITHENGLIPDRTLGEVLRSLPEGRDWAERYDNLPTESRQRLERAFASGNFDIDESLRAEEGLACGAEANEAAKGLRV